MKKIITTLILSVGVLSCEEAKYKSIGQEIIDGKVSATQNGKRYNCRGCIDINPKIWIQTPITTKELEIPFELDGRWKVGDSCLLIIQKYEIIKEE